MIRGHGLDALQSDNLLATREGEFTDVHDFLLVFETECDCLAFFVMSAPVGNKSRLDSSVTSEFLLTAAIVVGLD